MPPPDADRFFAPTYGARDLVVAKGEGLTLTDTSGRSYLDFAAGIAVSLLGHGDQDVCDAVAGQARLLLHASNYYHTPPTLKLAGLLSELSGYPSVFFCNSGTEANEAALKFNRAFHFRRQSPERKTVICFENAFHGRTMGALSATFNPRYREPFAPLLEGFVFLPLNDIDAVKRRLAAGDVAAVLVEPVQGEGGVRPCTPEFLHAVQDLCAASGALFILDEIQCSLGRLGNNFAFQHFGITPDIVTLAKPLAAGLPLGAVLMKDAVQKAIEPGDHGTTFGGNPVCAAAACVVLRRLCDDRLAEHVRLLEPKFAAALNELVQSFPGDFTDSRGIGFLRALDTVKPAKAYVEAARTEGLLILTAGTNTLRFAPPLIATEQHFLTFRERMVRAVQRTHQ